MIHSFIKPFMICIILCSTVFAEDFFILKDIQTSNKSKKNILSKKYYFLARKSFKKGLLVQGHQYLEKSLTIKNSFEADFLMYNFSLNIDLIREGNFTRSIITPKKNGISANADQIFAHAQNILSQGSIIAGYFKIDEALKKTKDNRFKKLKQQILSDLKKLKIILDFEVYKEKYILDHSKLPLSNSVFRDLIWYYLWGEYESLFELIENKKKLKEIYKKDSIEANIALGVVYHGLINKLEKKKQIVICRRKKGIYYKRALKLGTILEDRYRICMQIMTTICKFSTKKNAADFVNQLWVWYY